MENREVDFTYVLKLFVAIFLCSCSTSQLSMNTTNFEPQVFDTLIRFFMNESLNDCMLFPSPQSALFKVSSKVHYDLLLMHYIVLQLKVTLSQKNVYLRYDSVFVRPNHSLQTHLSETNLFVTAKMRTWQNIASVARVTLFPEDGGVYRSGGPQGYWLSWARTLQQTLRVTTWLKGGLKREVRTSWDTVHTILDRVTRRGILKAPFSVHVGLKGCLLLISGFNFPFNC